VFVAMAPATGAARPLTADGLAATLPTDAPSGCRSIGDGSRGHGRAAERDGDVPPHRRGGQHRAVGGGAPGHADGARSPWRTAPSGDRRAPRPRRQDHGRRVPRFVQACRR